MKKIFLIFSYSLILANLAACQTSNGSGKDFKLKKAVKEDAEVMSNHFKNGRFQKYVEYIHPVLIAAYGGEENLISTLKQQAGQLTSNNVTIEKIEISEPTSIVRVSGELQCLVSQETELVTGSKKVLTSTSILALSSDGGETWRFIDASALGDQRMRKLYPKLSSEITIPGKEKPVVVNN